MKFNPVDFIVDGFIIIRHKNIEGFRRSAKEKFREKVIGLKGYVVEQSDLIPLCDLSTILNHLTEKFGVFQFETRSETACYIGRLKSLDSKQLTVHCLNPAGKWNGQLSIRPNDVRLIEFNTDYITSLKLLVDSKRK